jgi:tRNA dimethylallyltransferase
MQGKASLMVNRVLIIAGPTAGGKSGAALDVAREFAGTVINADSMQVYRELHILSARPSPHDEANAPHRLYGVLPAHERCSAGRWLELAVPGIKQAWAEDRLPIITGGTGLYIKALLEGLSPIPDIAPHYRTEAEDLLAELGGEAFKDKLAELDPSSAANLPAGDRQRLIHAYEVVRATGKPLSQWQKGEDAAPLVGTEFKTIVLMPPRDGLYAAIDARFDQMIEGGALEEAQALNDLALDPSLPAMKAVGIPQLGRYLRGEQTLETACDDAKRASRNLAKRQMTWFRNQIDPNLAVFEKYSESQKVKIFSFIRNFVLTR